MISEIEKYQDHTKIFKATKAIKRKNYENPFVTDSSNKRVTNPQEMYGTIREHFNKYFYDTKRSKIGPCVGSPKPLESPITVGEVKAAAKKLNNNRDPGRDGISAELIKYAPDELI